jgi:hypothetical protein
MNQLQAVAMNEGYHWKKKLFSEKGRALLEKLSLAPWASRRTKRVTGAAGLAGSKDCGVNGGGRARSQETARGAAVDDASWGGTPSRGRPTFWSLGRRSGFLVASRSAATSAHSVRGLQCRPATYALPCPHRNVSHLRASFAHSGEICSILHTGPPSYSGPSDLRSVGASPSITHT